MKILETLKFDAHGLVPAIVQDADTGDVLMVAYMNIDAVRKTFETGMCHYWSRSRKKLWLKGETSGHVQRVREARIDCDQDAILFRVQQEGGACHTGYRSCFYRRVEAAGEEIVEDGCRVFDPGKVYGR